MICYDIYEAYIYIYEAYIYIYEAYIMRHRGRDKRKIVLKQTHLISHVIVNVEELDKYALS